MLSEMKVSAKPVAVPVRDGPASSPIVMTKIPCHPMIDVPPSSAATPNSASGASPGRAPSMMNAAQPTSVMRASRGLGAR